LDLSIDSLRNLLSSFSSSSPNVDGGKLLERVRAAIDDSTLVLNFSWADDANGAFLQTLAVTKVRHGFRVQPLQPEIDSLLKSKVLGLRVGAPDTDDGTLWRRLLPVGMDLSTFRSVVVLPDGPLNALPFESLVVSGADGMKELLMDHCEVRYEYCLTFLADTTAALPSGDVLACAPDFSTPDTSWASLDDEGTIKQAAPSFLRAGPGPLTQNVAEVEELLQWMPGSSIVGTDINEADLREELTGRAVLHFATHAICSARMPELSGILLSHSNGSANGERAVVVGDGAACMDGVLHAYEIQSMDLPVDLVVLSACETSLGKERLGEGAMSIARAFKYAGAKSIISSLWKVDDRATKEIMVKFYEKLAEGTGKADALAEAKRRSF
jgi:CHAT domain-containing protein